MQQGHPESGEVRDDNVSSKLEHLANASHTNVRIKAIQNVARLFKVMQLASITHATPGDTTLYGIRPGTVICLDPTIFRVKDADTLATNCDYMRDKVAQTSSLAFSAMSFTD